MSVRYRPRGLAEHLLAVAARLPGRAGRRARARLTRAWGPRAMADFRARLAGLGSGDVCLDLGANVGDFTALLAATGAEVHAWEPDPWAYALLEERFAGHPRVRLHRAAVAARPGTARLRRMRRFAENPRRYSHGSSIVRNDPGRYGDEGFEVAVEGFAEVLAAIGRPVALAKIDIEGAEFDLLDSVFARPGDHPVAAIFAETHERDDPALIARTDRLRRAAETLAAPSVNLYWP